MRNEFKEHKITKTFGNLDYDKHPDLQIRCPDFEFLNPDFYHYWLQHETAGYDHDRIKRWHLFIYCTPNPTT